MKGRILVHGNQAPHLGGAGDEDGVRRGVIHLGVAVCRWHAGDGTRPWASVPVNQSEDRAARVGDRGRDAEK